MNDTPAQPDAPTTNPLGVLPVVTRNQHGDVQVRMTPAAARLAAAALLHYDLLTSTPADELTDQMLADPDRPDASAFTPPDGWIREVASQLRIELLRQAARVEQASPGEIVSIPLYAIPAYADVKRVDA